MKTLAVEEELPQCEVDRSNATEYLRNGLVLHQNGRHRRRASVSARHLSTLTMIRIVQKGQGTAIGGPASCYGESVVPQPYPAPPNALMASWRLEMGLPQGPARAVTEPQDDIDG